MTLTLASYIAMNLSIMALRHDVQFPAMSRAIITDVLFASERFAVPVEMILAIMYCESAFDTRADSGIATGLMQLHKDFSFSYADDFYRETGYRLRRHQVLYRNTVLGAFYFKKLWERFGSLESALAAYHAGPYNYQTGQLGPETRKYVRKVMACARWGRFSREVYPLFIRALAANPPPIDDCYAMAWGSKYPAKKDPRIGFYF